MTNRIPALLGVPAIALPVTAAAGISGLRVDLSSSPDMGVFGWNSCVDQELSRGNWPQPGSGNLMIWDAETDCQRTVIGQDGVHAIAGAFYIYAYGDGESCAVADSTLAEPAFVVTDCSGSESFITAPGGRVGEGSPGHNPCRDEVPVRRESWGDIKRLYGGQ